MFRSIPRVVVGRAEPDGVMVWSEAETWRTPDGRVFARCCSAQGRHWMRLDGVGTFRFSNVSAVVEGQPEERVSWSALEQAYYRDALPWILQARGQEALHAGAVLVDGGVAAFCAASGTGKSTLVCALAQRGYLPCADDAVIFQVSSGHVRVVPAPFRVKLRQASAALLPCQGSPGSPLPPYTVPACLEPPVVSAVFVLERLADCPVELTRLSGGEALAAVLPHAFCFTLCQPERNRQMMRAYLQLVADAAVYRLRFPSGAAGLVQTLDVLQRLWNHERR